MNPVISCRSLAVACAALGALTAQDWALTASVPAIFGSPSIASDAAGVVLCDEGNNQTFVLAGSTWSLVSTATTHTIFGATIGNGPNAMRFGGIGSTLSNSIQQFDRVTQTWVTLPPAGAAPSPRFFASGTSINAGTAIIFGGNDGTSILGDTWQMTNVTGTATWLQLATPLALAARTQASMARGPGNTAVLFGGANSSTVFGDTWIHSAGAWSQFTGLGPAAAVGASMTFDVARNMTVLVHPNGETWEWNGFAWRRVGAIGVPLTSGVQVAFDAASATSIAQQPGASGFDLLAFTPSPANFQITLPSQCLAGAALPFRLANVTRSLPVLGQNLETRLDRVGSSALLMGAFEFASGTAANFNCNCNLGLALNGATQFILNVNGVGIWQLPISSAPALWNVALEMQGFAFDSAITCNNGVATTSRATIVIGR